MGELHLRVIANIRRLAEAQGLSVSMLVDRGGLTRSHFYAVLNGHSSPTLKWVESVAEVLEVSPFALVEPVGATRRGATKKS